MNLDEKDLKILEILKINSKLTTNQISKKTKIPITTIHNRIKKLENLEIIKNYTINLNYKKIGKPILTYVLITVNYILPSGQKIKQEDLAKQMKILENVEEIQMITGGSDILLKGRFKSIDQLYEFIIKQLRKIEGVDKTQTLIVLNTVANSHSQ